MVAIFVLVPVLFSIAHYLMGIATVHYLNNFLLRSKGNSMETPDWLDGEAIFNSIPAIFFCKIRLAYFLYNSIGLRIPS